MEGCVFPVTERVIFGSSVPETAMQFTGTPFSGAFGILPNPGSVAFAPLRRKVFLDKLVVPVSRNYRKKTGIYAHCVPHPAPDVFCMSTGVFPC